MATKIVLVDYENIQNLDGIDKISNYDIKVLVGKNQTRVPIDLVLQTQQFGKSLEWLKVNGHGKNALDFYIAFYMGRYLEAKKYVTYVIVSNDTGFDPLIEHINTLFGMNVARRVNNITQICHKQEDETTISPDVKKVLDKLMKIKGNKRPKKRSTLTAFVTSVFANQKSKEEIHEIVESMYTYELIREANSIIKYEKEIPN